MAGPQLPEKLAYWSEWLQGPLSHEANSIRYKRDVFNSWADIHDATNGLEGKATMFRWWVMDNYIHALAMAIRRLSDKNRKTRSLMSLLLDIQKHAQRANKGVVGTEGAAPRLPLLSGHEHQEYLRSLTASRLTATSAVHTYSSTLIG